MGRLIVVAVGLTAILTLSGTGVAFVEPAQSVVEESHPFNVPPQAQAGPPVIAVDGGPNDSDDTVDGDADIEVQSYRSSDPNEDDYLLDRFACRLDEGSLESFPLYAWYRGEHEDVSNKGAVAYGDSYPVDAVKLGPFAFTLRAEDACEAQDLDHVHGFVASSTTTLETWTFDTGLPAAWNTDGIAHVTDACNVPSNGAYLAFNTGTNADGNCGYASDDPVQGTASFAYDPGTTDHLALEFQTRFDIRDGVGSLQEELLGNVVEDVLTVQASYDGGQNWTKPNHTFEYQRLDEDLDDRWYRAGGIYNLTGRTLENGTVEFRFSFESRTPVDEGTGGYGWLIDDITLTRLED